jgi:hypothetical protein
MSRVPSCVALLAACCSAAVFPQAPNDLPAGAILQTGPGFVSGNNGGGAAVADGPLAACGLPVDDLWYRYVPASTGAVTVTTCPGIGSGNGSCGMLSGDSIIGIWADTAGAPGAALGCDDDACSSPGLASSVTVVCTAGVGLYVSVAAWGVSGSGGPFTIDFTEGPAGAPNDTPAGATVQTGPGAVAGNNSGGASLVDGPTPSCGIATEDLWYRYVPSANALLTISTCPAAGGGLGACGMQLGDSVIGVWSDAAGAPGVELACNDNGCTNPGLAAVCSLNVSAGVAVYVSVSSWAGPGAGGPFVVEFTESPPFVNDECTSALPLTAGVNAGLTNIGSTGSSPFSTCAGNPEPDAWFSYVPVSTGVLEASTCPADGGNSSVALGFHYLTVWTGTCGALAQSQCNIQDWRTALGCPSASRVQANVVAGVPVYISVGGFFGSQGGFDLALTEFPVAAGSGCNNAIPINNGPQNVDTTADGLAPDGTAPTCAGGATNGNFTGAWFSWTAPCQGGTAIIDSCATNALGFGNDTAIAVWDGCPFTPGSMEIACDDDTGGDGMHCDGGFSQRSFIQWPVVPGATYYFLVGGGGGLQGVIDFDVHCIYQHLWSEQNGPGTNSIRLENVDGPPNALVITAMTLDILHPGLSPSADYPNGWFFGVPMGIQELVSELTWPGGLPFFHTLDAVGYRLNFALPNGTTAGFGAGGFNASIYSVGVAFDPATGFAEVQQVTAPTLYVIP